MKKKNGFTLIELLAIIVILAIIAVITVPIILNIIENSRKKTTKDSAYGYIESVNRLFLSYLLDDSHSEIFDGYYNVSKLKDMGVSISGAEPILNSWVKLSDSQVTDGCLQFDEYKVEIINGEVKNVVNGECEEVNIPTIDTCPGCVFVYTTNIWYYSGTPTTLISTQYKKNYEDVISESGKNYFLGLKLNASGTIERAFACGIKGTTPFCLEGTTDGSKYSDNIEVLNTIFPDCGASASDSNASCRESSDSANADDYGYVNVFHNFGFCSVHYSGQVSCSQ